MVSLGIGFFTYLCIVFLFSFLNRTNVNQPQSFFSYLWFGVFVVFSSYYVNPAVSFGNWLAYSLLLYASYDDLRTGELNILLPFSSFVYFIILDFHMTTFIFVLFSCFLLLLTTFLTKERWFGLGDCIFLLPIFYLLGSFSFFSLFLSSLIGACILLYQKKENIHFTPYLLIGFLLTYYDIYAATIGLLLLILFPILYTVKKFSH